MADWVQLLLNGLLVGSVFALGAVGLTLVYGILRLVNFAHGDLLTLGTFIAFLFISGTFGIGLVEVAGFLIVVLLLTLLSARAGWVEVHPHDQVGLGMSAVVLGALAGASALTTSLGLDILGALVVAGGAVAAFSLVLDRVLWRDLRRRNANLLTLMIVSIGVAFILRYSLQMIFGGDLFPFFDVVLGQNWWVRGWLGLVGLGDLRVTNVTLWVLGTALVAGLVTHHVLTRTQTGKAMRALSDNMDLAKVAGINTDRVIAHVWVLGGFLAGIAGVLLAMLRSSFDVNLGWNALLSIFAAVILGGVGSVTGAIFGGLLIGVAQELSVPLLAALGIGTGYKIAVGFVILILTLLVRPQGIMGVEPS